MVLRSVRIVLLSFIALLVSAPVSAQSDRGHGAIFYSPSGHRIGWARSLSNDASAARVADAICQGGQVDQFALNAFSNKQGGIGMTGTGPAVSIHLNDCIRVIKFDSDANHKCGGMGYTADGRFSNGVRERDGDSVRRDLSSWPFVFVVCNDAQPESGLERFSQGLQQLAQALSPSSNSGSQTYVPQSQTYSPQQSQTYTPQSQTYSPQSQTYVPQSQTYAPQSQTYSQQSARPYALVGMTIRHGNAVDNITPLYAPIGADLSLMNPVSGPPVGGSGGAGGTYQPPGYVLTGIDVYRGVYDNVEEVLGVKLYWTRLTSSGLNANDMRVSDIMTSRYPQTEPIKVLRADPGTYISNLTITPSTHPDGRTFVHDVSIAALTRL